MLVLLHFKSLDTVYEYIAQSLRKRLGRDIEIIEYPHVVRVHNAAGDKARVYRGRIPAAPALDKRVVGKNILCKPCFEVYAEIIDVDEFEKTLAGSRLAIIISAAISIIGYGSFSSSLAV